MPTRAERNATNPDLGVLSARLLFSAQRELFSKLAAQGFDDIQPRQGVVLARREPGSVRRIAQVVGTITETPGTPSLDHGAEPVRGTAAQWTEILVRLGAEQPFTSFVFWPERQSAAQVTAFARQVVPEVRRLRCRG